MSLWGGVGQSGIRRMPEKTKGLPRHLREELCRSAREHDANSKEWEKSLKQFEEKERRRFDLRSQGSSKSLVLLPVQRSSQSSSPARASSEDAPQKSPWRDHPPRSKPHSPTPGRRGLGAPTSPQRRPPRQPHGGASAQQRGSNNRDRRNDVRNERWELEWQSWQQWMTIEHMARATHMLAMNYVACSLPGAIQQQQQQLSNFDLAMNQPTTTWTSSPAPGYRTEERLREKRKKTDPQFID